MPNEFRKNCDSLFVGHSNVDVENPYKSWEAEFGLGLGEWWKLGMSETMEKTKFETLGNKAFAWS